MQIVDAQIHLWTQQQAPPHHWRTPFRVDDALKAMDEAGIARAVNHPAVWDPDANDYAVEAARQHPDRFATLGWFPLDDSANEAAVDELMEKPGMLGLRFMLGMPDVAKRFDDGEFDWIFEAANKRAIPVGIMVPTKSIARIGQLARRNPACRILVDHLNVSPFLKLPDAFAHIDELVKLAPISNVAVKATATAGMSNEAHPFADTFPYLKTVFQAFGARRFFWGSDYTRMRCSWRDCVTMFTEHLNWLSGDDKDLVMGRAICEWIAWQ